MNEFDFLEVCCEIGKRLAKLVYRDSWLEIEASQHMEHSLSPDLDLHAKDSQDPVHGAPGAPSLQ